MVIASDVINRYHDAKADRLSRYRIIWIYVIDVDKANPEVY